MIYNTNGLDIISEIKFPELRIAERNNELPFVYIKRESVSKELNDVIRRGPLRQISQEDFLLDIPDVARFLVKGSSGIIVDEYPGAESDLVCLHTLSTPLGVLLLKNNILSLHASSVKVNDSAILFSGESAIGKSTLALGFYQMGYEILNDDISSVKASNDKVIVFPGLQRIKVWYESLEQFGYRPADFKPIRRGIEKYTFPVENDMGTETVPVKAIFFLAITNDKQIKHKKVDGIELFNLLQVNTFRHKLVKEFNAGLSHFRLCNDIINKIPFFLLSRSNDVDPTELLSYIQKQISEL